MTSTMRKSTAVILILAAFEIGLRVGSVSEAQAYQLGAAIGLW